MPDLNHDWGRNPDKENLCLSCGIIYQGQWTDVPCWKKQQEYIKLLEEWKEIVSEMLNSMPCGWSEELPESLRDL